jgi:predicted methyltransferase
MDKKHPIDQKKKLRSNFTLFQSHLDLAHSYWHKSVHPGDIVIDATCGNGQDTLVLCNLALTELTGNVYAIDIQPQAIIQTQAFLTENLSSALYKRVEFQQSCHSVFPESIRPESVTLIAYNLGYLPGNNKNLTTMTKTTLQSLECALQLVKPGGIISLTCYPGHIEGSHEQEAIINFAVNLLPREWSCCHHVWLNRKKSPSLLILQKALI